MATKKRSHEEVAPAPSSSTFTTSALSKPASSHEDYSEPRSKRAQTSELSKASTPLEEALLALNVEPYARPTSAESKDNVAFDPMVGREREYGLIEAHYKRSFETHNPQPLFLCGAPGCGKTASVNKIMASISTSKPDNFDNSHFAPYIVKINCATDLSATKSSALYKLLCTRLIDAFNSSLLATPENTLSAPDTVESSFGHEILQNLLLNLNRIHSSCSQQTQNQKPYHVLVLLDEVDHILASKSSFSKELHFLFSSWSEPWFILSLVSISNDKDLFDRNLPLLSQFTSKKGEETVQKIQYLPYTSEQLEKILLARIRLNDSGKSGTAPDANQVLLNATPIFDTKALKFLAGKVVKLAGDQSGDVRVLIDVARATISQAIAKQKSQVTLDVVLQTWKAKMSSQTDANRVSPLPMIQKCVLASLIVASKAHGSVVGIRPRAVEDAWKFVSRTVYLTSLPELADLWRAVELLESIGHIKIVSEKGNKKSYNIQNVDAIQKALSQEILFAAYV